MTGQRAGAMRAKEPGTSIPEEGKNKPWICGSTFEMYLHLTKGEKQTIWNMSSMEMEKI